MHASNAQTSCCVHLFQIGYYLGNSIFLSEAPSTLIDVARLIFYFSKSQWAGSLLFPIGIRCRGTCLGSDATRLLYLYNLKYKFTTMRTIHFSDARNNLKAVIDQTIDDADVTLITRRDAPNAVIMSQAQYDSMVETMHLLRSPANAAHLARSISQLRRGQVAERDLGRDEDVE